MIVFLCILFMLLNLADLLTTLYLINICHVNIEGNPFACFCYDSWGYLGISLFKIMITLLVLKIVRHIGQYALMVLSIGCVILGAAVIYNLTLIHEMIR